MPTSERGLCGDHDMSSIPTARTQERTTNAVHSSETEAECIALCTTEYTVCCTAGHTMCCTILESLPVDSFTSLTASLLIAQYSCISLCFLVFGVRIKCWPKFRRNTDLRLAETVFSSKWRTTSKVPYSPNSSRPENQLFWKISRCEILNLFKVELA